MNKPTNEQWEVIYSSTVLYKVEMLKDLLDIEDIPAVIVNKKDSSYLAFGEIELNIRRDDVLKAKLIVNRFLSDE
jgi:Putative prokaryotic signal transducing protein